MRGLINLCTIDIYICRYNLIATFLAVYGLSHTKFWTSMKLWKPWRDSVNDPDLIKIWPFYLSNFYICFVGEDRSHAYAITNVFNSSMTWRESVLVSVRPIVSATINNKNYNNLIQPVVQASRGLNAWKNQQVNTQVITNWKFIFGINTIYSGIKCQVWIRTFNRSTKNICHLILMWCGKIPWKRL